MFVKDSINTFILRCAAYLVAFLTSVIISNLGQQVKGEVAVIFLVTNLIRLVSVMGLDVAMVYYLRQKKYDYDTVTRNLNVVIPLLMLLWTVVLFPIFYYLHTAGIFGEIRFAYIAAAFIIAPLSSMLSIQVNIFSGMGEISRGNVVSFSYGLTYLILVGVITFFIFGGTWGVLAACIGAFAVSAGIGTAINAGRSRSRRGFEWNTGLIKDFTNFGIRTQPGALARTISNRTDLFLTNFYMTAFSAGVYSVALNWAELIWIIPITLTYVLFPYASGREKEASVDLTNKVSRLSLLILLLAGIVICVAFPFMEKLIYKPDYSGAVLPLIVVMPGAVMMGLFMVLMGGLHGLGKPLYATYASFAALISTVLLNILLIPRFGMIGAALATSITGCIAFLTIALYYRRLSNARWSDFLVIRKTDLIYAYDSTMNILIRSSKEHR